MTKISPKKTVSNAAPSKQQASTAKRKKAPSQAAKKRELESKLEALKTVAEKKAESISSRSKSKVNHNSVQRRLDDIEERKPKPPKIKVKPVKKVRQQKPAVISTC